MRITNLRKKTLDIHQRTKIQVSLVVMIFPVLTGFRYTAQPVMGLKPRLTLDPLDAVRSAPSPHLVHWRSVKNSIEIAAEISLPNRVNQ